MLRRKFLAACAAVALAVGGLFRRDAEADPADLTKRVPEFGGGFTADRGTVRVVLRDGRVTTFDATDLALEYRQLVAWLDNTLVAGLMAGIVVMRVGSVAVLTGAIKRAELTIEGRVYVVAGDEAAVTRHGDAVSICFTELKVSGEAGVRPSRS